MTVWGWLQQLSGSLQQYIDDVVLMQKTVVFEKQLALSRKVDDKIPHFLVGDQLRVKQILLNLVGNAVKFTTEGGITISALLLEQHENSVLVQITNGEDAWQRDGCRAWERDILLPRTQKFL